MSISFHLEHQGFFVEDSRERYKQGRPADQVVKYIILKQEIYQLSLAFFNRDKQLVRCIPWVITECNHTKWEKIEEAEADPLDRGSDIVCVYCSSLGNINLEEHRVQILSYLAAYYSDIVIADDVELLQ